MFAGGPVSSCLSAASSRWPAPTRPVLLVSVNIDGQDAQVLWAGAIQGLVAGIIQINVQLPDGMHSGSVPAVLRVGQAASQPGVTLAVQ